MYDLRIDKIGSYIYPCETEFRHDMLIIIDGWLLIIFPDPYLDIGMIYWLIHYQSWYDEEALLLSRWANNYTAVGLSNV